MKILSAICGLLVLSLISCSEEPQIQFVDSNAYQQHLASKFGEFQMKVLPKDAKLIKVFEPGEYYNSYAMIVFELDGNKYIYRHWGHGSGSTEILAPYTEPTPANK